MSGAPRYVVIAGELNMGAWFIHLWVFCDRATGEVVRDVV